MSQDESKGRGEAEREYCIACAEPIEIGQRVFNETSGGVIHEDCCGSERESYVGKDGEPLGPNDPIPEPWVYTERDHAMMFPPTPAATPAPSRDALAAAIGALEELSAKAAQGTWYTRPLMGDKGNVYPEVFITDLTANLADDINPEEADFIVALVNFFRSDLFAALRSAAPPASADRVGVPDGFVLVPVEPTEAMILARCDAELRYSEPGDSRSRAFVDRMYRAGYRAMIAAATAPAPATGAGWQPIKTAPRDGTLIGVPSGCAHWRDDRWFTLTGEESPGRPIQWPVLWWKSLDPRSVPAPPAHPLDRASPPPANAEGR